MSSLLGVPGEATHSKCPVLISMVQGLPQGLETPNKRHRQRFGPNDLHKNPPKTNYRIFPTATRSNDNFNFHVHACTCVYARARVYVCGSVKAEGRPLQLSKKKKRSHLAPPSKRPWLPQNSQQGLLLRSAKRKTEMGKKKKKDSSTPGKYLEMGGSTLDISNGWLWLARHVVGM